MITFICAIILLIGGYFLYGKLTEKVFRPDGRPTPAVEHPDGVDYVPMKTWRVFLIQLLNIAGTGPIFGALMGAVFGPVVFLWIVFGSILGGAVHDYMSGMISMRMNGASVSEIVGKYLGNAAKQVMRVFSVVLLILVGAVFTTSPAALIARLTPDWMNATFWVVVILTYYLLATLLPIDKVIGKLYPVFGGVLVLMAVGIIGGLIVGGYHLPELSFVNQHPDGQPVWPFMFITVAGVSFYGATGGLQQALTDLGQSGVVYDISVKLLGVFGGALAIIGVVVCPVSSGDTAFRSARLTIADWFHIDQSKLPKRLAITLPLLGVGALLTQLNFDVIWRYFSWSNQTLAMITLWAAAMYLAWNAEKWWYSLMCAVPAAFMSGVSCTYILMAEEGFRLSQNIAFPVGAAFALACTLLYAAKAGGKKNRRLRAGE